jgi:hypothetical protein
LVVEASAFGAPSIGCPRSYSSRQPLGAELTRVRSIAATLIVIAATPGLAHQIALGVQVVCAWPPRSSGAKQAHFPALVAVEGGTEFSVVKAPEAAPLADRPLA